jgi:polar amino acid transport system permease protein
MSSTTQVDHLALLPAATDYTRFKVVGARHPCRLIGSLFAVALIVLMLCSIFGNPRWGWRVFAQWFFSEPVLLGLGRTLLLTLVAAVCGFLMGTALALARLSKSPLLAVLAWGYIWLLRSIPLLVLLLILYNLGYLYRSITLGIPFTDVVFAQWRTTDLLGQFGAAVLGLSLNQAAFSAEIIRGGILSVDQGQLEAAAALGLPHRRQVFRIVLPQAMRAILPTGFNEIIGLAKSTSIVYVLALPELFYTVQVVYQRNMEVIPLLMVATVWYLVIMTVLSAAQYYVERYYARGAVRIQAATPLQHLRGWIARGLCRTTPAHAAVPVPRPRLVATPAARAEAPRAAAGLVRIQHVSKTYGAVRVLNDVSLTVRPGGVTAIIGPSGSGKSTLLRAINHLEKVDSGFISIDGQLIGYRQQGDTLYELRETEILRRRADVGMVFQTFNLFPHLTVMENIIEAPVATGRQSDAEARALAFDLLARVGLADRADAYPRQLSGGQQQRVAIARALALRPKVLLFDEPTSALDPELVGEVLDVIRELARSGSTLIIVTHEIGFAREVADTIVFLDAGEILEMGPPAQVMAAPRHARTREFLAKVL